MKLDSLDTCDPKNTIRLWRVLNSGGMLRYSFPSLHHRGVDVEPHLEYCGRIGRFRSGDTNQAVAERLLFIARKFSQHCADNAVQKAESALFQEWRRAALKQFPIK
jgi:hypothetical protein